VLCRHTGCGPARCPTALQWRGGVSSLGLSLAILPFFLGSLWGQPGGCSEEAALSTEPNRLNARKRLLVLLAVDGVSFVIS